MPVYGCVFCGLGSAGLWTRAGIYHDKRYGFDSRGHFQKRL